MTVIILMTLAAIVLGYMVYLETGIFTTLAIFFVFVFGGDLFDEIINTFKR